MTVTDATTAAQVSAPPARPSPVEEARRRFEAWRERQGLGYGNDDQDLELLEWQLLMVREYERLLGEERAVTLRAMSREAGSIRKLSEQMGRPFSTLRAQMKLNGVEEE